MHVPRRFRPPLTAGPLPFHRLFRGLAGFAWWRPLVAIGVGFAAYLVISVLFTLVLFPSIVTEPLRWWMRL